MAILTYAQAKAQVAKLLGSSSDTTLLSEAGDAIQRAFDKLEKADFEWLIDETVPSPSTPTDIDIVAGTSDYNLPSDFRKVYSCRFLAGDKRPLIYVEQRLWDRTSWDQSAYQYTFGYNILPRSSNTQAQVRLLGPPAAANTLRVRYYRTLTRPSADGTALDVVERYQDWIIYYARFLVMAEHGEREGQMMLWKSLADEQWAMMSNEDQIQPDRDDYLLPGYIAAPTFPPSHPYYTLTQLDGL